MNLIDGKIAKRIYRTVGPGNDNVSCNPLSKTKINSMCTLRSIRRAARFFINFDTISGGNLNACTEGVAGISGTFELKADPIVEGVFIFPRSGARIFACLSSA